MSKNGLGMECGFSESFNPQRRLHALYAGYKTKKAAQADFLTKVRRRRFRLKLKHADQRRVPKRDVCRKIRKLPGLGFFLAKN